MPRRARLGIGIAMIAIGAYLVASPQVVANALGLPHDQPTQMINLRASWGGTLSGLGAWLAWLPGLRPWPRALLPGLVGLVMWAMAGIGIARLVGFALDGDPDVRQWVWIGAEVALVVGCGLGLRTLARRSRASSS